MIEIFKTIIQFNNLVQNIQRNLDKTSRRKERIWPILDCPVHCLWIVMHRRVLFKLNWKNTIRCVRIYKQCTGQTKIRLIRSLLHEVLSLFLWIFWTKLLNWITVLNISLMLFIIKMGSLRGWQPPLTCKHNLILNFKLIVRNIVFISNIFFWGTECGVPRLLAENRRLQWDSSKIWKLTWTHSTAKYTK